MGIHLVETFTRKPLMDGELVTSVDPGPFANARAVSYTEIEMMIGERSASGHEHRVKVTMDRRAAARLMTQLASALGGDARVRDAIILDAFKHRTLDGGAYLDGVQDAAHGEDWS